MTRPEVRPIGGQVASERGIALGELGEELETLSIITWRFALKENFIPHVMVIPFGIWEISMGRNSEEFNHRMKLGIGGGGKCRRRRTTH